jgi:hypothetical protein
VRDERAPPALQRIVAAAAAPALDALATLEVAVRRAVPQEAG